MRALPDKPNAPLERGAGKTAVKVANHLDSRTLASSQDHIAVTKSPSSEIRVALRDWRGETRVEIREATAVIPGTYFPSGTPVTFPVDKLTDIIAALQALSERRAQ